jgi:hypothetical protein
MTLRINTSACNLDHNNHTVYMLSEYDDASQQQLFTFIRRIESAMRAAGIPVNNARRQPFHCTLARVQRGAFPVDAVVRLLGAQIPLYGAFVMDRFELAGQLVFAK